MPKERTLQSAGLRGFFGPRLALVGAVAIVGLVGPAHAQDEARLEARALFDTIGQVYGTSRCGFEVGWNQRPVAAETAQRAFGAGILEGVMADLVGPDTTLSLADVMDPRGNHPEAFCTEADKEKAIADFRGGANTDERLDLHMVQFGFPIFNASFTKAVVRIDEHGVSYWRSGDGKITGSIQGGGDAAIYGKVNGVWQWIEGQTYYSFH